MFEKTIPSYTEIDLGDATFIDEQIATWDDLFHVPVATNTFITQYTGLVLTKDYNAAGTKGKAYYRRVYYANLLSAMINNKMISEHDKMMNEYLLAHDEEKQLGFAYITAIIADADDMNNYADVATEHGLVIGITQEEIFKALEIPMVKMLINKYKLVVKNIINTIDTEDYRRDY